MTKKQKSQLGLRRLRAEHAKELYFLCGDCPAGFSERHDLERHQSVHSEERPYTCSEPGCGKPFKDKRSLKRHENVHSEVRPHTCSEPGCGQRFRQKSNLERHGKVHRA